MKILIIINNLGVGGAERLVIDCINNLLKRGIDVTLVTLKPEKENSTLSNDLKIDRTKWFTICFGNLYDAKSWFSLVSLIKKNSPTVVITHLWFSNTIGRIASAICRIKKIVSFEHNVYDTLKTRKMFLIDRFLQNISDYIIPVSEAVKNSLIRNGINPKKIHLIYNGIDITKYQYERKAPRNPFRFIFIGRLIEQKAVDILIEAFQYVKDSTLQIVGRGKEEESLRMLVNKFGLTERVSFLGIRKNIPDLLCGADCFVLPSRYEGLPMVLLEAIASAIPIILSNFASASEMITSGRNGIIVEIENVRQLSEAMERIKNDSVYRDRITNNVKEFRNVVSIDNHVEKLLNLIK